MKQEAKQNITNACNNYLHTAIKIHRKKTQRFKQNKQRKNKRNQMAKKTFKTETNCKRQHIENNEKKNRN